MMPSRRPRDPLSTRSIRETWGSRIVKKYLTAVTNITRGVGTLGFASCLCDRQVALPKNARLKAGMAGREACSTVDTGIPAQCHILFPLPNVCINCGADPG